MQKNTKLNVKTVYLHRLNEGFAAWLEFMGATHLFPKTDFWYRFIQQEKQIMTIDSLITAHPIEVLLYNCCVSDFFLFFL